jgi:hypothetical protein
MAPLQNLIPIRWTGGPLEIASRGKNESLALRTRQTLERFHSPASLGILEGSPIDCLVVSWAGGLAEDAEQQRTAAPLIEAARRLNLTVVGCVTGKADRDAALAAAKSAGLAAVMMEGFRGTSEFPVIPLNGRATVPWDSGAPVLALTDNVWPGVTQQGLGADAGPTAAPWLDSNGWYIQMARARAATPLWLMFDPPGKGRVVPAENYATALCDTEAAGARWVIAPDRDLQSGLAEGTANARAALKVIGSAAGFFREHAGWRQFHSLGVTGVISDFTGGNLDMSGEILNLMARRNLQFRVIWKAQAMAAPFTGLKALVYADTAAPAAGLRRRMMDFVERGGLLVTGPKWGAEGKSAAPDFPTQFDVRSFGKGRLAVARQELSDAYQVAVETQFLVSHANDLVKIYNSSSAGCTLVTGSPDGKRALVQVLSYSGGNSGGGRAAALRTVWAPQKYRSCRLWSIGGSGPMPLEGSASEEYFGMEYPIPQETSGYFALEFEV